MRRLSFTAALILVACHHNTYPDCSPAPSNGSAIAWQRAPGSSIEGRVIDIDGKAIPNASIFLAGTSQSRQTDSLGRFRFASLRPGAYDVAVRLLGYDRLTRRVVLDPGSGVLLTAVLERLPLRLTDDCGFGVGVARPWWRFR